MAQPFPEPCDRGLIESEPCPRAAGRDTTAGAKRWALVASVLASAMAFIDGSALTVALPQLADDLDTGVATIQWVLNGYVLSLAALTMVGGALADRYGRRVMVIVGTALFGVASIVCAMASTAPELILARVVQGIGAAILTPASLALIGEVFPRDERSAAIGTWAAASALTTAFGPVLGGWLTETFGWEAIFLINPPLALLAIVILVVGVPRGPRKTSAFDLVGALLLTVALTAMAYALSSIAPSEVVAETAAAASPDYSTILSAGGVALVAGIFFVVSQRRSRAPMIPGYIAAQREFVHLNLSTLFVYTGLSAVFFILPFLLVDGLGLSPTRAGLAFLPFTLAIGLLSQPVGLLADRIGERPLLIAGPLLAAAGFIWLALSQSESMAWRVFLPLGLSGLGFALLIAPLTAAVLSSVEEQDGGLASGLNNTASRVAQMIGVALAAVFAAGQADYSSGLLIAACITAMGGAWLLVTGPGEGGERRA